MNTIFKKPKNILIIKVIILVSHMAAEKDDRRRSRGWCFTINNYTVEDGAHVEALKYEYLICGREKGAKGTEHMQCYVFFAHARSFQSVRKMLGGRAHIEPAKGTPQQNRAYCSKEGDFIERGVLPVAGKRRDIDDIKDLMNVGKSMRECLESARSYQAFQHCKALFGLKKPKLEFKKKEVWWFWGPTGTGKSRRALAVMHERNLQDDCWISGSTLRWFQFYMGEKAAIFDDLRFSSTEFSTLLRLLDGYPFCVENKGGAVWWEPSFIIITTPSHPKDWSNVSKGEDVAQLLRRIDVTTEFKAVAAKENIEIVNVE